jgi:hypothetical protein
VVDALVMFARQTGWTTTFWTPSAIMCRCRP